MHPAYSVIIFTCASGAGLGLLIGLAALVLWHGALPSTGFAWIGFALALGLTVAGLLSSTLHLGRPERAMLAFSQWRTSWLSREGVAAVATLAAAGLLALLAVLDAPAFLQRFVALPTIVCAAATIWCTGMIYASLTTIRAWNMQLVPWIYLALALASGAVLQLLLYAAFGFTGTLLPWIALVLVAAAGLLKIIYWRRIDNTPRTSTAGTATGLSKLGSVRVLEAPHTQANFVMREMGYEVARKHALKLRQIALLLAFGAPLLLLLISLLLAPGAAILWLTLATLAMAAGLVIERWLFFAEAQHVVTLFYGAERA